MLCKNIRLLRKTFQHNLCRGETSPGTKAALHLSLEWGWQLRDPDSHYQPISTQRFLGSFA
ncbi:hypothetical protein NXF25_001341 [Crotalus adamanteus]|uniref:Uncharacterized protein n=1 Tax=Crotalus adamanteus TaxID=8729 RepID=A0AAW1C7P6_CROAD